ncbi:uncharacterized protein E0L32_007740 [Thyridium curvatum]|uniref:Uncharacterized protein n=1 Tax=Thyridium curvatum TaxID=1093900 RepID=A0A507B2L4_9PEZI|nr:uncharacterized protein E0L32_007740 [Thyridium curvatum]TPX11529.1 hypothetical protein E0L32_007740 [Thyridium curvatum]
MAETQPEPSRTHGFVPTASALRTRRLASLVLAGLLVSAAIPFTPVAWVMRDAEISFLLDRCVAGLLLVIAAYFQYAVAGVQRPVVVSLPAVGGGGGGTTLRNGRIERDAGGVMAETVLFVWRPEMFWPFAAAQAAALAAAEFGDHELFRRCAVVLDVAALWALGWPATPRPYKVWAWGKVKEIWVMMLVNEFLWGSATTARRRAPGGRALGGRRA